jgi:late competence protein required for DNA uptake (superfamily II DNA/RNA helicase)
MLVFIDESGDGGYKFEKGSSLFLVFVAIIFKNSKDADILNIEIERYKTKNKITGGKELKHSKLNKKQKLFLSNLFKKHNLNVKTYFYKKDLNNKVDNLYKMILEKFLKEHEKDFQDKTIFIDGKQDKIFLKSFKTEITCTTKISTKNIKFVNSKTNNLIQLADFIAGEKHDELKS